MESILVPPVHCSPRCRGRTVESGSSKAQPQAVAGF
jgi:hypothetical protein